LLKKGEIWLKSVKNRGKNEWYPDIIYKWGQFEDNVEYAGENGHRMKNFIMLLILLPVLTSCNTFNAANNKIENKTNNSVIVQEGIPEDVVDMIFKRIDAIEKGDIAAFRSTLGEMQDGVDYHYQLLLLYNFFGDFFDIDPDTFDEAIATGEGLTRIACILLNSEHPLKSRNTGLIIKRLEIKSGEGLRVTLINNKNEEIIYNFLYY
jgi:hypothetical protein